MCGRPPHGALVRIIFAADTLLDMNIRLRRLTIALERQAGRKRVYVGSYRIRGEYIPQHISERLSDHEHEQLIAWLRCRLRPQAAESASSADKWPRTRPGSITELVEAIDVVAHSMWRIRISEQDQHRLAPGRTRLERALDIHGIPTLDDVLRQTRRRS